MYFIALALHLRWQDGREYLGPSDGPYAHAAVMQAISAADASLGQKLHDMPRSKHITIAIVESLRRRALLRLTFMAEDGLASANALCNVLSQCPHLRLGDITCAIEAVDMGDRMGPSISTWADLNSGNAARHVAMSFITPTAFTKDGLAGKRFMALFPDPRDVFGSLARRWRALEGPVLPDGLEHFLQGGGCVIAGHTLHTVTFKTSERTQVGFVGEAQYEHLLPSDPCAAAINALARLAVFSGVGYQTARGMGAVRVSFS